MRTPHTIGIVLLAAVASWACDDRAATAVQPDDTLSYPVPTLAVVPAHVHEPGGVTLEPFARGAFPHPIDAQFKFKYASATQVVKLKDASDVIAARLTIAEGGSVGWHRHPGSAIGVVQSGTFGVIEETDCVPRLYHAGDVVFHRGQNILDVGFNAGEGDVVVYLTFLGVPGGQPPTMGVPSGEAPC